MKLKNLIKPSLAAVGAVGLFAATSTPAEQIVQQQITALVQAPWGETLTFNKFDPSLGKLTGVQIDFTGKGNASLQIEHGVGAGSVSFTQLGSTVQITAPGLIALTDNAPSQTFLWFANQPSPVNFTSPIVGTSTLNVISSTFWSAYTGTGTLGIDIDVMDVTQGFAATGDFNQADWIHTFGGADVKLTYNYSVPEVASFLNVLLGGLALGGVSLVSRRKTA